MRLALLLALAAACGDDSVEETAITLPASPSIALAGGQEIPSICVSWTLDNDEPLVVDAIDMSAGPGWHHAAWFYVPEAMAAGPDGAWDCAERGFEWTDALAEGGLVFGQTTQTESETQRFPAGGALVIPPRARLVGDAHLLNAGTTAIDTSIQFTLHTVPEDAARAELRSLYLSIRSLALPPHTRSEFSTECDILHDGFALYYAMPHYHQLGLGMTVEARDSGGDYHTLFAAEGAVGEPLGRAIDTSIQFTLHAVPAGAANAELRSLYLSIRSLALPPHGRSEFSTECDILHDGFALYYAMPHYHQLGLGMTVEAVDAAGDTHPLFTADGGIGEPLGRAIAPPFRMTDMVALRIACRFDNPGEEVVTYGFQGEMCNLLAFTDSDSKWLGGALDDEVPVPLGERDGVARFEVPCSYVLRVGDAGP